MSTFLFSIDLEEFYAIESQQNYRRTPLPELTERYLEFLRRHKMRATFFVVGEVALQFREAVRAIAAEGHELGCHTHTHRSLDQHDRASLRDDLRRNLDAVRACADSPVVGFRAPILSLTEKQQWAYEVLAELGFAYSSSVLTADNPLHGWPGFGSKPRRVDGVLEIPVTLARALWMRVPVGAGTYFRVLPFGMIARGFRSLSQRGLPVVGYFHPYDADTAQERVMSRGVNGSRLMNSLLYVNRAKTMVRLESIVANGFNIVPYREYIASLDEPV